MKEKEITINLLKKENKKVQLEIDSLRKKQVNLTKQIDSKVNTTISIYETLFNSQL